MSVISYGRIHGIFEVMVRGEKIPVRRNQSRFEYTRRVSGKKLLLRITIRLSVNVRSPN